MAAPGGPPDLAGTFSVLNMTLADVEAQLGGTQQLQSMNLEDVLKGLWGSTTLDTLPSFTRAPSWQPKQQKAAQQQQQQQPAVPPEAATAAGWEAAAAASAAAAQQQQVQAQAAALAQAQLAADLAPQKEGEIVPLASLRMDQIFSWFMEQQSQQVPAPNMTLSQIFDSAGLHLAGGASSLQHQLALQAAAAGVGSGSALGAAPASLGQSSLGGPASGSIHSLGMHPQAMATASMLPPGVSPAGPFASGGHSLPADVSLMPPGGFGSLQPQQRTMDPPPARAPAAAAARATRARKRKDAAAGGEGGGSGSDGGAVGPKRGRNGGLSAAEAARQAKAVADRAAAELQQLPDDDDDPETRAIKRAIKNRESAARSRAKRQEYTATLEQQVEDLKKQNVELRHTVIATVAAPPDPHAGELDGELMRRSRTGPI